MSRPSALVKPRMALALLGTALLGAPACTGAPPVQAAAVNPSERAPTIFDTRTDPQYGDATPALRGYLAAQKDKRSGPQHFCVLGYEYASNGRSGTDKTVYIHWREQNKLMDWDGRGNDEYVTDSLILSSGKLDLAKDVVETEADIKGSTYLVTRAWVDKRLADCARHGTNYTVIMGDG